jgi:inosose dehydratase
VNWNNDDVPGWRPRLPTPALLDAMAASGYAGTEIGGDFPADPALLGTELRDRGLLPIGAYRWLRLADDGFEDDLPSLERLLDLLQAVGARHLIVAIAMTPERVALAGHVPEDGSAGLDDAGWDRLAANLQAVGALAVQRGIRVHYHNHVGTYVETPAEVERLIAILPDGVDLCFDTGHYAFGGGAPLPFVQDHGARIGYLHLKDVDPAVLSDVRAEGLSFLDALRRFIFCPLGEGMVDVPAVVAALEGLGYQGWFVFEQVTCRADPTETATRNRAYLRDRCGL